MGLGTDSMAVVSEVKIRVLKIKVIEDIHQQLAIRK